jgi:hypothetical protein
MRPMKAPCVLTYFLFASIGLAGQVYVPAGTILPSRLSSSIDTHENKPGDRVAARLMQDLPLGAHSRVPAGSRLIGDIIDVQQSSVTLKFDRLVAHKRTIDIRTNLRAIASMMEIDDAQLPTNAAGGIFR